VWPELAGKVSGASLEQSIDRCILLGELNQRYLGDRPTRSPCRPHSHQTLLNPSKPNQFAILRPFFTTPLIPRIFKNPALPTLVGGT
jgi:hypothetical protein